jgi:hypothetical protein
MEVNYESCIKMHAMGNVWVNSQRVIDIPLSDKNNLWYSVQEICKYIKDNHITMSDGIYPNFKFNFYPIDLKHIIKDNKK